jgi:hypothetical protein
MLARNIGKSACRVNSAHVKLGEVYEDPRAGDALGCAQVDTAIINFQGDGGAQNIGTSLVRMLHCCHLQILPAKHLPSNYPLKRQLVPRAQSSSDHGYSWNTLWTA